MLLVKKTGAMKRRDDGLATGKWRTERLACGRPSIHPSALLWACSLLDAREHVGAGTSKAGQTDLRAV